jgi:hypothetical protein
MTHNSDAVYLPIDYHPIWNINYYRFFVNEVIIEVIFESDFRCSIRLFEAFLQNHQIFRELLITYFG